MSKTEAGRVYWIHRNTVRKWVNEVRQVCNWLCLDERSCPEKYRVSAGLKRLSQVETRIQKRLERDRIKYVKNHPGELVHFDTKKLPKLQGETLADGKEYLYAAVMPDKTDSSAAEFLEEVLTTSPFIIEAVMSDNGKEYKGKITRGHVFECLLDQENIKHVYTKPYTPKTNGKTERVIMSILAWHWMINFTNKTD